MTIDEGLPADMSRRRVLLGASSALLAAASAARAAEPGASGEPDCRRDFDFEFGVWRTRLKRLRYPLTGSTTRIDYEGKTVVRPVWNGRANLVELFVDGLAGSIEALSLRLTPSPRRRWLADPLA